MFWIVLIGAVLLFTFVLNPIESIIGLLKIASFLIAAGAVVIMGVAGIVTVGTVLICLLASATWLALCFYTA